MEEAVQYWMCILFKFLSTASPRHMARGFTESVVVHSIPEKITLSKENRSSGIDIQKKNQVVRKKNK